MFVKTTIRLLTPYFSNSARFFSSALAFTSLPIAFPPMPIPFAPFAPLGASASPPFGAFAALTRLHHQWLGDARTASPKTLSFDVTMFGHVPFRK
jgi:hypothetical protein